MGAGGEVVGEGEIGCVRLDHNSIFMNTSSIIQYLISQSKPFLEIKEFSSKPGIYALFFHGRKFPFDQYHPKKDEIIYIGKTESSQLSRDLNTHFSNGKTGSSTLRRSFGAFLAAQLGLNPVPRSQIDVEKERFSLFKFDDSSEEVLTNWMKENLGLSFYPFPKSKSNIDQLESLIIKELKPVLNIDRKNPLNVYAPTIKALRKEIGIKAYSQKSLVKHKKNALTKKHSLKVEVDRFNNIHKYEDIWRQLRSDIFKATKSDLFEINIGSQPFKAVGNRKSYSFNLEFINCDLANNIGGSAVARDLARVLMNSSDFYKIFAKKHVKIRLDKSFTLIVTAHFI